MHPDGELLGIECEASYLGGVWAEGMQDGGGAVTTNMLGIGIKNAL